MLQKPNTFYYRTPLLKLSRSTFVIGTRSTKNELEENKKRLVSSLIKLLQALTRLFDDHFVWCLFRLDREEGNRLHSGSQRRGPVIIAFPLSLFAQGSVTAQLGNFYASLLLLLCVLIPSLEHYNYGTSRTRYCNLSRLNKDLSASRCSQ